MINYYMNNKREPLIGKNSIDLYFTQKKTENLESPRKRSEKIKNQEITKNSNDIDFYHDSDFFGTLWFSWVNNILEVNIDKNY